MSERAEQAKGRVREYLDYLTAEKGLAANSVLAYGRDLRKVAARLDLERASQSDLLTVLRALRLEGLSPRSLARLIVSLRGFFGWLLAEEVISADPTADVELPRASRRLPRYLAFDEVEKLLAAPDRTTAIGARDAP